MAMQAAVVPLAPTPTDGEGSDESVTLATYGLVLHPDAVLQHDPRATPCPSSPVSSGSPLSSAPTHSSSRYPPTPQTPFSRHSSLRLFTSSPAASAVSPHPHTPAHLSHVRWRSSSRVFLERDTGAVGDAGWKVACYAEEGRRGESFRRK